MRAAASSGPALGEAGHVGEGERLAAVAGEGGEGAEAAQVHGRVGHQVEEDRLRRPAPGAATSAVSR